MASAGHPDTNGAPNKFPNPLKDHVDKRGPIGFQGLHGAAQAPVENRNVRIKMLP
jgi:hypothetical protein